MLSSPAVSLPGVYNREVNSMKGLSSDVDHVKYAYDTTLVADSEKELQDTIVDASMQRGLSISNKRRRVRSSAKLKSPPCLTNIESEIVKQV